MPFGISYIVHKIFYIVLGKFYVVLRISGIVPRLFHRPNSLSPLLSESSMKPTKNASSAVAEQGTRTFHDVK